MRLSELIIRFIDWFYRRPVSALLPRQTFRYAVCGGANVVFGWGCYFLHVAAMLIVFPLTFFTGFWLNRHVAFRRSPLATGTQLFRYLLSVAGSVVVNYLFLKFFVELCGFWATPSQMMASLGTMVYSYLAAKYFTFRNAVRE